MVIIQFEHVTAIDILTDRWAMENKTYLKIIKDDIAHQLSSVRRRVDEK